MTTAVSGLHPDPTLILGAGRYPRLMAAWPFSPVCHDAGEGEQQRRRQHADDDDAGHEQRGVAAQTLRQRHARHVAEPAAR